MHGYDNFHLDVLDAFNTIIRSYGFSTEIVDENAIVILQSQNCILSFDMDRTDLDIRVIDPNDPKQKSYRLSIIIALFVPAQERRIIEMQKFDTIERVRRTLRRQSELLEKYLHFVLKGNFYWIKEYENFVENEEQIYRTLGKSFSVSHPVYQKFLNGDTSWRDDLKTLS